MIGRLHGTLIHKQAPHLLLDVQGVGYELEAPMSTFYELPESGNKVTLLTHLVVREDAHLLFGFLTEPERRLFRSLVRVSGVGAKLALTILSGMSGFDFARCIGDNDVTSLTRLPGVGKKTAERLIVEMRDRLSDWQTDIASNPEGNGAASPRGQNQGVIEDALGALVALGYKPQDASRMIRSISTDGLASEEIIRSALQHAVRP